MANDSIASIIEFLQEVSGSGNTGDHAEFLSNVRWHVTKLECAKLDLSENIGSMRGYVQKLEKEREEMVQRILDLESSVRVAESIKKTALEVMEIHNENFRKTLDENERLRTRLSIVHDLMPGDEVEIDIGENGKGERETVDSVNDISFSVTDNGRGWWADDVPWTELADEGKTWRRVKPRNT